MLDQYAKFHFYPEEALTKEIKYPDFDAHALLHHEFKTEIHKIISEINVGYDIVQILEMLKRWWLFHINGEDIKYKPYAVK